MNRKGWPLQVAAAFGVALLLGIAFFLFSESNRVSAQGVGESYVPGRVIIHFHRMVDLERARDFLEGKGYGVLDEISEWNTLLLEVRPGEERNAIEELSQSPLVGFVERDCDASLVSNVKASIVGGNVSLSGQWFLTKVGFDQVMSRATNFPDVPVGLIDTRIDVSHTFFAGKVTASGLYTEGTPGEQGTFVAGTVLLSAPNAVVRDYGIPSTGGSVDCFSLAKSIHAAIRDGVRVLEIDYGTETPSSLLERAVQAAYDAGVFMVAPAGSDGVSEVLYPAAYPEVVAVSALNGEDDLASYSNYGPDVDVAAPGGDVDSPILSVLPDGEKGSSFGSPEAAAEVAGAAAIAIGHFPEITNRQLANAIYGSCDKIGSYVYRDGRNNYLGFGRIDVPAMLNLIDIAEASVTPTVVRVSVRSAGGNIPGQVVVHNSSLVRHVRWHASLRGGSRWAELQGPFSGDLAPGGSAPVSLMIKADVVGPGTYTATLLIAADDSVIGLPTGIPVILDVAPAATPTPEILPETTPAATVTPTPTVRATQTMQAAPTEEPAFYPVSYSLFLGDDTYQEVDLIKPFRFPGTDREYTKLWVASNGFVTFQDPGSSMAPYDISCDYASRYPASVFVWGEDLNPEDGGSISVVEDSEGFTVRWNEVPLYMWRDLSVSFQARFRYDGEIEASYESIPLFLDGVVAAVDPDGSFVGEHICPLRGYPGPISGDVISWR